MISFIPQSPGKPNVFGRLKHNVMFHMPRLIGGWLVSKNMHIAALLVLKFADNNGKSTFKMLGQLEKMCRARGNTSSARHYQQRLRHAKLIKYTNNRNFRKIFAVLADLEKAQRPGPMEAGRLISREIVKESGRRVLLKAALPALKRNPRSVYLIHVVTMCEAMLGDYRNASQRLARELARPHLAEDPLENRRFTKLRNCWRTVDLIARDEMDFVGESDNYNNVMDPLNHLSGEAVQEDQRFGVERDDMPKDGSLQDMAEDSAPLTSATTAVLKTHDSGAQNLQRMLRFKEHYLQGRMQKEYLEACDQDLANATSLMKRLQVIEEMLRQGLRRVPSYADAYDLATKRLVEIFETNPKVFKREASETDGIKEVISELCAMLRLTRKLGMVDASERIVDRLLSLSERQAYQPFLWAGAAEIANGGEIKQANQIIANIQLFRPKSWADIKAYLRWAKFTGKYKDADKMFLELTPALRLSPAVMDYVNILERQGQFAKALEVTTSIHANLLSNPSKVNSVLSHKLISRVGELRFLAKTAALFKSVPQPKEPKGVVLLTPRNIHQLRLYPLMVLNEMKRQGWAVISIVEGILPRQLTGNPAIDAMSGAIMRTAAIHPSRSGTLRDVEDFEFDAVKGRLQWRNVDLSHSMWEDSAINRRMYNVDYGCPSLRNYLSGLADWTRSTARILDYAYQLHKETGIKVATMALYNSRLPDALHRLFCNEYGNPDTFFALHAANGYQNYFTNFSTNTSQRFVLRNMTRYNQVRSASFPVPELFELYYEENRARIPELMERFVSVTKIKRSTVGVASKPPEAMEAAAKISQWRQLGGKVVCAFGKVVCDSSVPFDGGPAHPNMKDWINDCVRAVKGSTSLLLIKPHPHEMNNSIATFPNEFFTDLIEQPLNYNYMVL